MTSSVQPRLDISRTIWLTRVLDDIEADVNEGCGWQFQVYKESIAAQVEVLQHTQVASIKEDVTRIQQKWESLLQRVDKVRKAAIPCRISLKTHIAEFVFRSYQLTHFEEEIASKQKCRYWEVYGKEMKMISRTMDRLTQKHISVIRGDIRSMRARWKRLYEQCKNVEKDKILPVKGSGYNETLWLQEVRACKAVLSEFRVLSIEKMRKEMACFTTSFCFSQGEMTMLSRIDFYHSPLDEDLDNFPRKDQIGQIDQNLLNFKRAVRLTIHEFRTRAKEEASIL